MHLAKERSDVIESSLRDNSRQGTEKPVAPKLEFGNNQQTWIPRCAWLLRINTYLEQQKIKLYCYKAKSAHLIVSVIKPEIAWHSRLTVGREQSFLTGGEIVKIMALFEIYIRYMQNEKFV